MKLYQTVKEKLLSAHWLMTNDPYKFNKEFLLAKYVKSDYENDPNSYLDLELSLKEMSKKIQDANKFYLDFDSNVAENLTPKEIENVAQDIKIFLPYEKTFIQFEDVHHIHNIYLEETTDAVRTINPYLYKFNFFFRRLGRKKNTKSYGMFHAIYAKKNLRNKTLASTFIIDPSVYMINPQGEYWIDKGNNASSTPFSWGVTVNSERFHGGRYRNTNISKDDIVFFEETEKSTLKIWFYLNLLLSYPALSNSKTVKGKTGVHMGGTHGYKSSHLLTRPAWEHKVLKLDLYGNASSGHGGNGSAKAFHSVRGHLRRLSKGGKVAFVKSHFRGSKQVGTVEKEYAIQKKK